MILDNVDEETMQNFCLLYIILYHEAAIVSLLEIVLYHREACAVLGDSAIDLVDYCAAAITQLIVQYLNLFTEIHRHVLQNEFQITNF